MLHNVSEEKIPLLPQGLDFDQTLAWPRSSVLDASIAWALFISCSGRYIRNCTISTILSCVSCRIHWIVECNIIDLKRVAIFNFRKVHLHNYVMCYWLQFTCFTICLSSLSCNIINRSTGFKFCKIITYLSKVLFQRCNWRQKRELRSSQTHRCIWGTDWDLYSRLIYWWFMWGISISSFNLGEMFRKENRHELNYQVPSY